MSSTTNANECTICHNHLSEPCGAVTHCGHCFHTECYGRWKETCSYRSRMVTCPVCNGFGESFIPRLFLDFNEIQRLTEENRQLKKKLKTKQKNFDNLKSSVSMLKEKLQSVLHKLEEQKQTDFQRAIELSLQFS